ncbi:MAG TPA: glycosyltransferase family 4 protein [Intrasporangium sp.]|nr:glycosyltransferase family 4 protein [Intrasporangium sp.]
MRPLKEVHAVVPAGVDDPRAPSGGNTYDRRVLNGLRVLGWAVTEHPAAGAWPRPDDEALTGLTRVFEDLPDQALVLVDGLVASCAESVLVPAADRVRFVILVHLPLGLDDPAAAAGEQRVLAAASAVVTSSAWTRDLLLGAYGLDPAAVHVANPGVQRVPMSAGTPDGDRLLCVAAVTAHKGHTDLVAALALIRELPWTCVLAGALTVEPAVVQGVRVRLAEAGLSDRVHLAGALTGAELEQAYAAADLVVLPSHVETYGMVVTEALAHGVPVVATAVGGVPEALGDTETGPPGMLVPAGRPDALAAALRSWLSDRDFRESLRERARKRRDALSPWSRTAEQISAVLAPVQSG